MTEKENMLAGMLYNSGDAELIELRLRAHGLSKDYNELYDRDTKRRDAVLRELLGTLPPNLFLQGPVQFDYGLFTIFGKDCYANFNFVVLDCCPVTIGDKVFFGPNCTIATPMHPMRYKERNGVYAEDGSFVCREYAKPITIGSNCWIASNVVICGGVTIGEGCVIGAGSVVTRDIPANSFAAGNPCRVIKPIDND